MIIEESKARNKTFYRKGGIKNNESMLSNDKASQGMTLPNLKSMIPENSLSSEIHNNKMPSEYDHIRYSGNGTSLRVPPASLRESNPTSMRAINRDHGLGGKAKAKKTKLPPLRSDFR